MIFNYFSIPETTSLPPFNSTGMTAVALWEACNLGFISQRASISRPFFCSQSIRFIIRQGSKIYGIIVNYPYNEEPTKPLAHIATLMENAEITCDARFGYNKAADVTGVNVYLHNYSWPDEQNHDLLPVRLHKGIHIHDYRCFKKCFMLR